MRRFAEGAFLTAPVWNWGPYYVERVKAVLDGTWETQSYYGDMAAGIVDLAPVSDLVPDDVAQLIEEKKQAIIDGEFEVLQGPIRDQDGKVRIPEGEVMSLEDALGWQWFVEGVQGTIPKG
jgi:basic membrane protein A